LLAVPESGKLILTGQYLVGCFFWQQHLLFISTFFGKSLAEQTNKQETIISFLLDVSKPQNSASMLSEKKIKPRFHLEQGLNLLCVIKKVAAGHRQGPAAGFGRKLIRRLSKCL
jgi:hypothetical protein